MRTTPHAPGDACFLLPRPLQGGEGRGEGVSADMGQTLTPTLFEVRERGNEQGGIEGGCELEVPGEGEPRISEGLH